MLNQVVIVGRMNKIEEKDENINLDILVTDSIKNKDGIYETYTINCLIYNNLKETLIKYCNKGDLLGIRGKIKNINNQNTIIAEKITFLSSKKESED